ncbi:MAG: tRNA pseudouridine(55) synthase TruB [Acidimicrobiales bacterium]
MSPVDGLLVLDKPTGCTSHDVVARCRRIYGQKKVGHAGTLDPDATGVLLVGLGQATRLLQYLSGLAKRYTGEVVLGVATSTLDAAGTVTGRWDMSHVSLEAARKAALSLTGEITQIPPMVSALKVGGRRLHELARAGIEVERAARPVMVSRFDVELADVTGDRSVDAPGSVDVAGSCSGGGAGPVLAIDVVCSTGTYVRTLAADLGTALGGGAHLRHLRRLAVGSYGLEESVRLDALETTPEPAKMVLGPLEALRGMARLTVTGEVAGAVGHGQVMALGALRELGGEGPGPWALLSAEGALLAVYEAHGPQRAKPAVVLSPPAGAGAWG